MNKAQKVIVILGLLALLAMCLVPPWFATYSRGRLALGYGFIFNPPARGGLASSIDFARLVVQAVALAACTGIGYFVAGWIRGSATSSDSPILPQLNSTQRKVGVAGIIVALFLALCPAWDVSWNEYQHVSEGASYDDAIANTEDVQLRTVLRDPEVRRGFILAPVSPPSPTRQLGTIAPWSNPFDVFDLAPLDDGPWQEYKAVPPAHKESRRNDVVVWDNQYVIGVDFSERSRSIRLQQLCFELAAVLIPTFLLMALFRQPPVAQGPSKSD